MIISVGFLVAYDYELLKTALPLVYNKSDYIYLAIDKHRLTLKGKPFHFDEGFMGWIKAFDAGNKVVWVEAPFYNPDRNPHDAELFMRNYMLQQMPFSDWYFQLDPDEYVMDFDQLVDKLETLIYEEDQPVVIETNWITLFKQNRKGFFIIGGPPEKVRIATNKPYNTDNRMIVNSRIIFLDATILHQSWARSSKEVWQKLTNWSHTHDFDIQKFFKLWKRCSTLNYRFYWQFHPLNGPMWQYLRFVPAYNIQMLIKQLQLQPISFELRQWPLGLKHIIHRLGRIYWRLP
jgi:hypothetical protein